MPKAKLQSRSPNERHAGSFGLVVSRWLTVAVACAMLGALALVSCGPSAPPKVEAAAVIPTAAAPVPTAPPKRPARAVLGSSFTQVSAENGVVTLPATGLDDGRARFYSLPSGDKLIPFFVVQGGDGVVRAAFDACDICFEVRRGFRQEGGLMVCNNCGNAYPITEINFERGGCNPVGLKVAVQGDQLAIQLADLEAGAGLF